MQKQLYTGSILNKIQVSEKVVKLDIKHHSPSEMAFVAGQFVSLKVNDTSFRSYSICSNPVKTDQITIIVSVGHEGAGANYVRGLNIGDEVKYVGPSGRYKLSDDLKPNLTFFSTGTGLAPFIPMFYELISRNYKGKIALYAGFRNEGDILFDMELQEFSRQLNMDVSVYLSAPSPSWKGLTGRITLELARVPTADTDFYACGHPDMVEEVKNGLIRRGVNENNIFTERFTKSL